MVKSWSPEIAAAVEAQDFSGLTGLYLTACRKGDKKQSRELLNALRTMGPRNADCVDFLTRSGDPFAREASVKILSAVGDRSAIQVVAYHLSDPNSYVRQAAVEAIGLLRGIDFTANIIERLEDVEPHVRTTAADALGRLDNRQAVEPLARTAITDIADVRIAAMEALGTLEDGHATPALLMNLCEPNEGIKLAALGAMKHIGIFCILQPLFDAMGNPSSQVEEPIDLALRAINKSAVTNLLRACPINLLGVDSSIG